MWARILNAALGIWLMAAPAVLGYGAPAEVNSRIVGPVVATFAIVAIAGATRPVCRVNTLAGAWLLLAPWVLGYDAVDPRINDMLVGAFVIAFSLVKGKVADEFGGGWSSLWKEQELQRPDEAAG